MKSRLAILLFCLPLATLLVGQRFGIPILFPKEAMTSIRFGRMQGTAIFVDRHGNADVPTSESLKRGEIIRTGSGAYASLLVGNASRLSLDERTDVELTNLKKGQESFKLIRGRILLEHWKETPMTLTTNFTKSFFKNGIASFVNVDFQEQIHIIPFEGTVVAVNLNESLGTVTKTPVRIHETAPQAIIGFAPSIEAPPTSDFYAWAREMRSD